LARSPLAMAALAGFAAFLTVAWPDARPARPRPKSFAA
jgi:hypothetical protein